jgi:hypothetical protein
MTWIRVIPPQDADDELRRCYEAVYALYPPEYQTPVPTISRPDGSSDSVVAAHSLIPRALLHSMAALGVLLELVSLDAELAATLKRDYTQAALSEQDRAMLDYVAKLTRHAWKTTPDDLERLRAVGFDDTAILQLTLIASWFNSINRVADGLGVGR